MATTTLANNGSKSTSVGDSEFRAIKLPSVRVMERLGLVLVAAAVGMLVSLPQIAQQHFVDENAVLVHSLSAFIPRIDLEGLHQMDEEIRSASSDVPAWIGATLAPRTMRAVPWNCTAFDSACDGILTHAILRARKGDGKEAIAFIVDYDVESFRSSTATISGLGIGVTMMKYLSTVKWLARDVIFVAVPTSRGNRDHSIHMVKTWLRAYHSPPLKTEHIRFLRAGAIRSGVALRLPPARNFESVSIASFGGDGQLPNFDVLALLIRVFRAQHVPLHFSDHYDNFLSPRDPSLPFLASHKTMLRFLADAASGSDADLHSPMLKYNVDAATIVATGISNSAPLKLSTFASLTWALEQDIRGLNNLIERLHHATFMYIVTSPSQFASLGIYVAVLVVLVMPLFGIPFSVMFDVDVDNWQYAVPYAFSIYGWSAFTRYSPTAIAQLFGSWNLVAKTMWFLSSFLSAAVFLSILPPPRTERGDFGVRWKDSQLFRSLVMTITALASCPVFFLNIALGTALLFPSTMLLNCASISSRILQKFVHPVVLVVFCPVHFVAVYSVVYSCKPIDALSHFIEGIAFSTNTGYIAFSAIYVPAFIGSLLIGWFNWRVSKAKAD